MGGGAGVGWLYCVRLGPIGLGGRGGWLVVVV